MAAEGSQEKSQEGKFLLQHRSQAAIIQSRIFLCFSSFYFAARGSVVLGQGDGSHPGALPGSEDGADSVLWLQALGNPSIKSWPGLDVVLNPTLILPSEKNDFAP